MFHRLSGLKLAGLMVAVLILGATLYSPWLMLEARAQACPSNNLAEGLVSAFRGISGLGNTQQICLSGAPAYISTGQAEIRVDTYDQLFSQYYEKSKGNKVVMNKAGDGRYHIGAGYSEIRQNTLFYAKDGDMVVSNDAFADIPEGRLGIFFVEGNLYIPNNINYGQENPKAGLVFIVKGEINIDSLSSHTSPQRIDAVLISEGVVAGDNHSICTACDIDGNSHSQYVRGAGTYDPRLIVSGGMVSLNNTKNIELLRTPVDTSEPAETIIADPKYLVILKDTISTTIKIWSEI